VLNTTSNNTWDKKASSGMDEWVGQSVMEPLFYSKELLLTTSKKELNTVTELK
jgi:hypothetical protein